MSALRRGFRRVSRIAAKHWPILLPYAALFWLLRAWFLPGLIVGEDFNPTDWLSPEVLRHSFPWPATWDPHYLLGYSLQLRLPLAALMASLGLLERLGLSWQDAVRILYLLPLFVVVVLAPYLFAMRFLRSPWAASVAALVFSLNTWTVGLIQRGHFGALLAYALLPPIIWLAIESCRRPIRSRAVLAALLFTIQANFEYRYAYLTALCCAIVWLLAAVHRPRQMLDRQRVTFVTVFAVALVGFNLYWILPTLLVPFYIPPSFVGLAEFVGASGLQSVLRVFSLYYPYYRHIESTPGFVAGTVTPGFILLGVLALAGFVAGWRNHAIRAVAAVWIAGLVVASGPLSDFGSFNQWLFVHFPGMDVFRDITKVMSVACFATSFGIATAVVAVGSFFCRLMDVRAQRVALVACGVAFVAFYLPLMRDAYNPLRFSNFATTRLDAGDRAYRSFVRHAPSGGIVYFPALPEWDLGDARHGRLSATILSSFAWPYGFATVGADPSSLYAFWSSAVAPRMLCAINARYLVVTPDRFSNLYEPWQVQTQRGEAEEFFAQRPWLRRINIPGQSRVPVLERYAVFGVQGCTGRAAPLHVATTALGASMSPQFFGSLLRAGVVGPRTDAIFAGLQTPGESAFGILPNVSIGPNVPDSVASAYRVGRSQVLPQLRWAYRLALLDPKQSRTYLFAPSKLGTPSAPAARYLKAGFEVARPGAGVLTVVMRPIVDKVGVVRRLEFSKARVRRSLAAPARVRELIDPKSLIAKPMTNEAVGPEAAASAPLVAGAKGVTFGAINPYPVPISATLTFSDIVAAGNFPLAVHASAGSEASSVLAGPAWAARFFGVHAQLVLRAVRLEPGWNAVRLAAASKGATFSVARNVRFSGVHVLRAGGLPVPLAITVRRRGTSASMIVSATTTGAREAQARIAGVTGLRFPLSADPRVTVRYVAPPSPLELEAAFSLAGPAGKAELLSPLAPGGQTTTVNLAAAVQRALLNRRAAEVDAHAANPRWLAWFYSHPHLESSDYRITGIDVLVSQRSESATPGATAELTGAGIAIPASPIDAPVRVVDRAANFSRAGSMLAGRLRNANLHVLQRTPAALSLQIGLARSAQQRAVDEIRPGDHVTLVLTNGTTVSGDVTRTDRDFVSLRAVGGSVAVRRSAIALVKEVIPNTVTEAAVTVPIEGGVAGDHLLFDLRNDGPLLARIRLVYKDPATHRVLSIVPQDRSAANPVEERIPADWQSQGDDDLAAPPMTIGPPVSGRLAAAPQWTHYDIDLDAVVASELHGNAGMHLRGIRFSFAVPPGVRIARRTTATVVIANVQLAHWISSKQKANVASSVPVVAVDNVPIPARDWRRLPERGGAMRFMTRRPLRFGAGEHTFVALPNGARYPATAALEFGTPSAAHASLRNAHALRDTEVEADATGRDALVVMPTGFSAGWRLAVLPKGARPTGNPIVDFLRYRGDFLHEDDHVIADGAFNGWLVPKVHGRVLAIFVAEPISRIAVVLEIVLLVVGAFAWRRWIVE